MAKRMGVSLSVGRGEKSKKGGLTAKGRAKYNRATGSNLKAPVTEKQQICCVLGDLLLFGAAN